MRDYRFNPSTQEKCDLEVIVSHVLQANRDAEGTAFRAWLKIEPEGIRLSVTGTIIGHLDFKNHYGDYFANEEKDLVEMKNWLEVQYRREFEEEILESLRSEP